MKLAATWFAGGGAAAPESATEGWMMPVSDVGATSRLQTLNPRRIGAGLFRGAVGGAPSVKILIPAFH